MTAQTVGVPVVVMIVSVMSMRVIVVMRMRGVPYHRLYRIETRALGKPAYSPVPRRAGARPEE